MRGIIGITDRTILYNNLHKLVDRQSNEVSNAIIKKLKKAEYCLHTMTFDNDKCFADHMTVADALNINTYFTRPYTSEDQGTVENRID